MASRDARAPGREPERACEGFACVSVHDIRYDPVCRKWLCPACWAKVDPATHGKGKGDERRENY